MPGLITRRRFMEGGGAVLAAAVCPADVGAPQRFGEAEPFSFEILRQGARELAARPYEAASTRLDEALQRIDYDAFQGITFLPECGLWAQTPGHFPVRLFHLGRFFKRPVKIHLVDGGRAREVIYRQNTFTFSRNNPATQLPEDLGYAGFRVMAADGETDWLSFLGAAYFRSSGQFDQYGLSARGIAIDTARPQPEEFPRFTSFWLEQTAGADAITLYALMDGPSVSGAFRFVASKRKQDGVLMNVDAALYPRKDIDRMGVAPLTSMYWFSETNRHRATDWRPEIHDSDGLAMWTGAGERIWRPLNNPVTVKTNSFFDTNPRGFGLIQRDRDFTHYQDDGVFYDRRPSVWVEPLGPWGEGSVQLVEIPTDDEIHDNIVAYWVPKQPVRAGSQWSFAYRLHWRDGGPADPHLARVIATRIGRGGIPGQPRPKGVRKFVIDFAGGKLKDIDRNDAVDIVASASRGEIENAYSHRIVGTDLWRAVFDLRVADLDPVDLRCYLASGSRALSETWLYQYLPETSF